MKQRNFKFIFTVAGLIATIFTMITCITPLPDKPSPIPEKEIKEYKASALSELPPGQGKEQVIANCVHCHSSKLIAQNQATREGWLGMIRWMQKTQGLWPLGSNEETILDYLGNNFSPQNKGRRAPLTDIKWYKLDD
ncbi:MAG: monoheme cytochrome C [Bacteroidetes bacterium]|nr:monoheme cytochrome C [Bacteroidota bacterium]MDA1120021.1 monoheme cytochrome C [Bacteroidota bacterium]